ncbi:MAG: FHA domain-containing protein [Bacteroidales bacterium]|nr:FHA domain-containing protein [Bacteroidales bacterium]
MSTPTKNFRQTLSGSIGAGMSSVFSPGGRKYYILEHKVSSRYHRAGEEQEIIVDNIELGRDSRCQVRFDESFSTVSRRHAAIVKDGDMWKLVQLSQTNTTFLNGRPVQGEWYLQNGDEIQLSVNGPKLGFIIPTGKKATVGSIGLTRRMSLFRKQALLPYKRAIWGMAAVLVVAVGALGVWNFSMRNQLNAQSEMLAQQILEAKGNKEVIDSLTMQLGAANTKIAQNEATIQELEKRPPRTVVVEKPVNVGGGGAGEGGQALEALYPYIYHITTSAYINDKCLLAWTGTGFLLDNGHFVTAQHCVHIDDVAFDGDDLDPENPINLVNAFYYTGRINMVMDAISPTDKFSIKYTYDKMPFSLGPVEELSGSFMDDEGQSWVVRAHVYASGHDWAHLKVDRPGGIPYDSQFSKNMPVQTPLSIVGFPAGQGETQGGRISPVVSTAVTSRSGVEDEGYIKTSNDNSDHGNSGGPVLTWKDGRYVVVGVLSGVTPGDATNKGRIVPIGNAFN